jgi:hypothetical protein
MERFDITHPLLVKRGINMMKNKRTRVQRQGQIYRFSVKGTDYAAFIWQLGVQFRGRIEGNPQVPEYTGRTALVVRDALQQWLVARSTA